MQIGPSVNKNWYDAKHGRPTKSFTRQTGLSHTCLQQILQKLGVFQLSSTTRKPPNSLVSVTLQRSYSIYKAQTAKGKPVPDKEVVGTMLKLLEPFSESLIDDDAAVVRKTSPAEREGWGNPIARTEPPSVVADAERDPYAIYQKTSAI